MSVLLTEANPMSRPKKDKTAKAIGPILKKNLYRLGYGRIEVNAVEVAKLVAAKTGKSLSRQRISAMMNAVHIEPATIDQLAKGLGVKASELTQEGPVEID